MSYPYWKRGALLSTCNLFLQVYNEKTEKNGICVTNCIYCPQYLPDGGIQWLLVKPWTSSVGRCMRYCTSAPPRPSKWPPVLVHLLIVVVCLLPWWPPGQYGASSHPMAASRGFRCSPGYAASDDAVCIAPAHCHGYHNGGQQRYICLPPPHFLFAVIVA